MEDKITKRIKIDWLKVIHNFNYEAKFKRFCKGKKIVSKQRLGYMFIKHIKGRDFIRCLRRVYSHQCEYDEMIRISKINWISEE